jgi:hypothetical protein
LVEWYGSANIFQYKWPGNRSIIKFFDRQAVGTRIKTSGGENNREQFNKYRINDHNKLLERSSLSLNSLATSSTYLSLWVQLEGVGETRQEACLSAAPT